MSKTYPLSSAVTGSPKSTYQPGTSKLRRAHLEGENIERIANPQPHPDFAKNGHHMAAMRTPGEGIKMVKLKTPIGGNL